MLALWTWERSCLRFSPFSTPHLLCPVTAPTVRLRVGDKRRRGAGGGGVGGEDRGGGEVNGAVGRERRKETGLF